MAKNGFETLVRSRRLPAPGAVAEQVLELTRYGKCTPGDVERAAAPDEELSRFLLELANANRPGKDPAEALALAVEWLGAPIVRTATLAFSLFAAHKSGPCASFDYTGFWSRSLARAVAAQVLSRVTRLGTPAEAFALGLLGDVGRLALAYAHPDRYAELAAAGGPSAARDLAEAERRLFGIDHGELAGSLLEHWGVPTAIANAVRRYESLGSPTSGGRMRCIDELLLVAHSTAEFCQGGAETSGAGERALDLEGLARRTGLSPQKFHQACSRIVIDWQEWTERMGLASAGDDSDSEFDVSELAEPAPRVQASHAAEPSSPRSGGLRVLAVDDDPVTLGLLERHLGLAGHGVTIARAGDDALRIAFETAPQLVVADWQMPGLDGLELCRELRRHAIGRKIYYLLLTGHGEVENVVSAFDAGVDDYVEKPFDPQILLARIQAGRRIIDLQEQVERDQATQKMQVAELQLLTRKLKLAAMTDVLTGLPNRRFAMKRLAHAWKSSESTDSPLSIVMIDVDEFKRVNDAHGHDAGDAVLRDTGRLLRSILREREDVCRLGGEEFLVICEKSELRETACLAERLRAAVAENVIRWEGFEGAVTLSLGVAQREAWMPSSDHLLKAADEAVYAAKAGGRNQVCIAAPRTRARSA